MPCFLVQANLIVGILIILVNSGEAVGKSVVAAEVEKLCVDTDMVYVADKLAWNGYNGNCTVIREGRTVQLAVQLGAYGYLPCLTGIEGGIYVALKGEIAGYEALAA